MKAREREAKGEAARREKTTLSGVPKTLPSLLRAYEISARAAAVGFDWAKAGTCSTRSRKRSPRCGTRSKPARRAPLAREEEMGDLLFAITNLSRKLGIEPEGGVRRANEKFTHEVRRHGARVRRARPRREQRW
jgi:uncharacterized protein YabN with tetrapyrrole methylase and pyrophosphatase domain